MQGFDRRNILVKEVFFTSTLCGIILVNPVVVEVLFKKFIGEE
jgi:hypothetical protein